MWTAGQRQASQTISYAADGLRQNIMESLCCTGVSMRALLSDIAGNIRQLLHITMAPPAGQRTCVYTMT